MHCHIFGVVYLVVFAKLICLRSHAAQAARQDLDSSMSHQAAARQEEVRVPRALAKDTWTATHDGVQQSLNANQQSLQPSGALVRILHDASGYMQVTNWICVGHMQVIDKLCVVHVQGMCRSRAGCMQIMCC